MTNTNTLEPYNRLRKLYLSLGIDVTPNNENDAEIYANSQMLNRIREKIDLIVKKLFCSDLDNLDMYIELLDINRLDKTYEQLADEIVKRLSMNFGEFDTVMFEKALAEVGCSYYIVGNKMYFQNVKRDKLPILHKFIDSYKVFFNIYYYENDGTGLNFDEWDALNKNCIYYDKLQLSWNFLEKYKESK